MGRDLIDVLQNRAVDILVSHCGAAAKVNMMMTGGGLWKHDAELC